MDRDKVISITKGVSKQLLPIYDKARGILSHFSINAGGNQGYFNYFNPAGICQGSALLGDGSILRGFPDGMLNKQMG